MIDRRRAQAALRAGGLLLVGAWLLSGRLQGALPFWVPFAILAATELEFVLRGWQARTAARPSTGDMLERRLPGSEDADLGWVETVDEDGEVVLVPAPPRSKRRSAVPVVVGLIVAVILFAWAARVDRRESWSGHNAVQRAQAERVFTGIAAQIAQRPVRVRCDDGYAYTGAGSDAAGVAFPRRALAYLEPQICQTLYRIRFDKKLGARDDAAFAITVLAHEATHLRDVLNEATTECFAIQEGVRVARGLGLTPGVARSLMQLQLDRDRSDSSVARLDYRLPPGCREGGALDLHPSDPAFP